MCSYNKCIYEAAKLSYQSLHQMNCMLDNVLKDKKVEPYILNAFSCFLRHHAVKTHNSVST